MRDGSLGIRRRVVVQNLPPISTLLEEERERSARGHRVTPPQREARSAKREIEREGAHAHLVERERVAELAGAKELVLLPSYRLCPPYWTCAPETYLVREALAESPLHPARPP